MLPETSRAAIAHLGSRKESVPTHWRKKNREICRNFKSKKAKCRRILYFSFSISAMRESAKKCRQWLKEVVAKPKSKPNQPKRREPTTARSQTLAVALIVYPMPKDAIEHELAVAEALAKRKSVHSASKALGVHRATITSAMDRYRYLHDD